LLDDEAGVALRVAAGAGKRYRVVEADSGGERAFVFAEREAGFAAAGCGAAEKTGYFPEMVAAGGYELPVLMVSALDTAKDGSGGAANWGGGLSGERV